MSSFDGVNAVTIIFAALCVFAIGYRFYGLFIAAKVLNVDANRVTSCHRRIQILSMRLS